MKWRQEQCRICDWPVKGKNGEKLVEKYEDES